MPHSLTSHSRLTVCLVASASVVNKTDYTVEFMYECIGSISEPAAFIKFFKKAHIETVGDRYTFIGNLRRMTTAVGDIFLSKIEDK
jgi:hypothetical protein